MKECKCDKEEIRLVVQHPEKLINEYIDKKFKELDGIINDQQARDNRYFKSYDDIKLRLEMLERKLKLKFITNKHNGGCQYEPLKD